MNPPDMNEASSAGGTNPTGQTETSPPPAAQIAPASRTWEVLCHISAFAGFIGIPFGNIVGPLIVWLLKRAESPSVDAHGRAVLNFQISWSLWFIAAGIGGAVLGFLTCGLGWWLLAPVMLAAGIALFAISVIGAIKASSGELYRFPWTYEFIK